MNDHRHEHRPSFAPSVRALRLFGVAMLACLLTFSGSAFGQVDDQEPPLPEPRTPQTGPDVLLSKITAAIQGVTTRDSAALSRALHLNEKPGAAVPGASPNTLVPVGDLDGDGVPEMLLKWALPDVAAGADLAPELGSSPVWGIYLLSWDGVGWKASRLLTGVEHFTSVLINLGAPVRRALAVVNEEDESHTVYPSVFQVKDHAATLLWDAQADDSRYEPLRQGEVVFQDRAGAPTEMVVTGRADPGFLQVAPQGHRGFQVRMIYHWDGRAYIPVKTEYSADPDYTLYRFISALHLHDYRSAYALVVPAKFLGADSPTLEAFRQFIQDNWPEFLQDEVFEAPELPAGSPDEHVFVLPKPAGRFVYHPVFSSDGKFLLAGLTRTREALPAEP